VGLPQLPEFNSLAVDSEEPQNDKSRRDIVLRAYAVSGHVVSAIIEAKHPSRTGGPIRASALNDQLNGYLNGRSGADCVDDKKVGVALTRMRNLAVSDQIAFLTWTDIMDVLGEHPDLLLAQQFRDHLLMSSKMRYFDVEVLSVPAAETINSIQEFRIHAHPADRTDRNALYLAPRRGGSYVDALYSIASVFDFELGQRDVQLMRLREDPDSGLADRVAAYLDARAKAFGDEGDIILRMYNLEEKTILLSHRPRAMRGVQGDVINWRLSDFLDGGEFLPQLS